MTAPAPKNGSPHGPGPGIYRVPFFADLPWWLRAIVFAAVGSGLLYHLATGHDKWYWWFPATAAWLGFVSVVLRRKQLG